MISATVFECREGVFRLVKYVADISAYHVERFNGTRAIVTDHDLHNLCWRVGSRNRPELEVWYPARKILHSRR